jgi:hypothetical protein
MTKRTTNFDVAIRAEQLNRELADHHAYVQVVHHVGEGYVLELWTRDEDKEYYILDLSPKVSQVVICHILWAVRATLEVTKEVS